jgi:uncharacterized protein (TIGR00661 family)
MRILYGVQGTGNGHISRCRLMAKALQAEGVQVDYVLSGRDADAYFDMQAFGEYRCLPGLSFATKDGAIDLWATVNRSQPLQLLRDIRQLSLDDYDSIISDFEPVTAWAAKRQNRPVLGISHQASFRYAVPQTGGTPVARFTMRHFAPVQQAVGLHWFHFGHPILPPIIAHFFYFVLRNCYEIKEDLRAILIIQFLFYMLCRSYGTLFVLSEFYYKRFVPTELTF